MTLTTLFIVLKLVGVISWSWFWVLSPIWIETLLAIVLAVIGAVLEAIAYALGGK